MKALSFLDYRRFVALFAEGSCMCSLLKGEGRLGFGSSRGRGYGRVELLFGRSERWSMALVLFQLLLSLFDLVCTLHYRKVCSVGGDKPKHWVLGTETVDKQDKVRDLEVDCQADSSCLAMVWGGFLY